VRECLPVMPDCIVLEMLSRERLAAAMVKWMEIWVQGVV
jgi:hypothetical protein